MLTGQNGPYSPATGWRRAIRTCSVRRTDAVAAELIRDGVPHKVITIQGFGETHHILPAGQAVRELQNRRVESVIG